MTNKKELYIFGEAFGLPSIDPQCLALIAYLNVVLPNQFDIIACNDPTLSPTGELPMFHDGKTWIGGANRIISYLSKTGHNADESLSRETRAKSVSFQALIDEYLSDAILFSLFADSENFVGATRKAYANLLAFPGRYFLPVDLKKRAVCRVQKYGGTIENGGSTLAHAEKTEIYDHARKCYGVLNRQLGKKLYLFTNEDNEEVPSTLDTKAFAYLALQLYPEIPSPRFQAILESQYPNLVAYCNRCRDRFLINTPKALSVTSPLQISSLFSPALSNPFPSLSFWFPGKVSEDSSSAKKSSDHSKAGEKPAEQKDFERKRIIAISLGVVAMIGYVFMNGLISIQIGEDDDEDGIWVEDSDDKQLLDGVEFSNDEF